ncbi:MAG: OadG family protein [Agathobacter sp.]|nr:OadG family protein [Agathobacter sp.]
MKKKIALFLSVLSVVMMLGACGTQDPTTVDYNGVSYNELYQESLQLGTALGKATEADIQKEISDLSAYGEETAIFVDLCYKWLDAMEVSGAYVGLIENGFTVTKSGKTLTTDLMLEFEDRDVVFQLVYNYHNMELTGVTINPVYSFGEKMAKAGMNTLISISIVFAVLIIISLLISCFKIFPYLEAKKKEKEAAAKVVKVDNSVVTQIEQREEQEQELADDTELVAVIAAAIAAYEGTSTDGFVVRSIRRR